MTSHAGMLLWMWLLIAPVIAIFLIAPGGTSTGGRRIMDRDPDDDHQRP